MAFTLSSRIKPDASSAATGEGITTLSTLPLLKSRLNLLPDLRASPALSKSDWLMASICSPCLLRFNKILITGRYLFQKLVSIRYYLFYWFWNEKGMFKKSGSPQQATTFVIHKEKNHLR